MRLLSQVKSTFDLLTQSGPEKTIAKKWLLQTSHRVDAKFRRENKVDQWADAKFQYVRVQNKTFVWPREAPIAGLVQMLSELFDTNHPHHYEWGNTTIKPGDYVIDVGSCEGGFAAGATEAGAHVVAVEPSRSNAAVITKLFELRGLPPPNIAQCLLGSNIMELYFEDDPMNPGASRICSAEIQHSYPVSVLTLDELVRVSDLPRVDFIKCDAEGEDVDIIKSGIETLKKFRPKIAVTTYHRDNDFADLYHFLSGIGYSVAGKGFLFTGEKLRGLMLHAW